MSMGERIKEVRKKNSITQKAFSKELGISQAYVSKLEKNGENPSEMLLRFISYRYAVNLDWLKTGVGASALEMGADREETINTFRHFTMLLERQFEDYSSDQLWPTVDAYTHFVNILTDPFIKYANSHGISMENPANIFLEHIDKLTSYLWAIVKLSSETARSRKQADYKAFWENSEHCQRLLAQMNSETNEMVRAMRTFDSDNGE